MPSNPLMPARFRGGSQYGGVQFVSTEASIGTGGTSVGNSATTAVLLPKPACSSAQLIGLAFTAQVAGVSAGQTVTMQVFKRDNSGTPADRTLTATKSLLSDIITVAGQTYPFAVTSTSIQNLSFQTTDACRIDVVASGSVSTQPTVVVTALWAVILP